MRQPTIVIAAYNRPLALQRLLQQLVGCIYEDGADLVVSIDKGGDKAVVAVAEDCIWPHGKKKVTLQSQHLGLRRHITSCGDLTEQYGSIILLEDDLGVSPWFYHFAQQAMLLYKEEQRIAGISLYGYATAESSFQPFLVPNDGFDNYFMQFPSSWGQLWTWQQWQAFRQWEQANSHVVVDLPNFVKAWSGSSWKREFLRYLIATDKYFAFPRVSLTTNYGDKGANFSIDLHLYQVALEGEEKSYHFSKLENSNVVFDSSFELYPLCLKRQLPYLAAYDFAADIYATKDLDKLPQPFVLTSKPCGKSVFAYANNNMLGVMNVLDNVTGEGIFLAEKEQVTNKVYMAHIEDMEYVRARMDGRIKPGFLNFLWFKTKYTWLNYANVVRKLLFTSTD